MDDRLMQARRALAQAEQKAGLRHADGVHTSAYDVPDFLRSVLPNGLLRGTPIAMSGSVAGVALLTGIAAAQQAWVAFLGVPDVGWSMLEKSGIERERFAYVRGLSLHGPQVVNAAIDGFDVVVVGSGVLDRREQRVIERRVRTRECLFISLGPWWAPGVHVSCDFRGVRGISGGIGHIRTLEYDMSSTVGSVRVSYGHSGWVPQHSRLATVSVLAEHAS